MRNIKAILEYDGTNYKGFQVQRQVPTVQMALEQALEKLTGEKIKTIGAGRTDTGVHALGQTINFVTDSTIPTERFAIALNSCLPKDIRVLEAEQALPSFHARYSAAWKRYRYLIRFGTGGGVFWRNYALIRSDPIDLGRMQEAAACLAGTHDFRCFCAGGGETKTTIRTITQCRLEKTEAGAYLEVVADGFLYHMVRNIVGTLLQVGCGKRHPGGMPRLLASKDRRQAGPTAPPQGLYLVEVGYPDML